MYYSRESHHGEPPHDATASIFGRASGADAVCHPNREYGVAKVVPEELVEQDLGSRSARVHSQLTRFQYLLDTFYHFLGSRAGRDTEKRERFARCEWGDPALGDVDSEACLPYLLVTVAASGYVRTNQIHHHASRHAQLALACGDTILAREVGGGKQELTWTFVLSPSYCGSERTGFFPTPQSLRLSDTLALCSGYDFFSSTSGSCASLEVCICAHSNTWTRARAHATPTQSRTQPCTDAAVCVQALGWLGCRGGDWLALPRFTHNVSSIKNSISIASSLSPPSPSSCPVSPSFVVKGRYIFCKYG